MVEIAKTIEIIPGGLLHRRPEQYAAVNRLDGNTIGVETKRRRNAHRLRPPTFETVVYAMPPPIL